jgi:hypothetical protein
LREEAEDWGMRSETEWLAKCEEQEEKKGAKVAKEAKT